MSLSICGRNCAKMYDQIRDTAKDHAFFLLERVTRRATRSHYPFRTTVRNGPCFDAPPAPPEHPPAKPPVGVSWRCRRRSEPVPAGSSLSRLVSGQVGLEEIGGVQIGRVLIGRVST